MSTRSWKWMPVVLLMGAVAACVDSPSAPLAAVDQNQLATSFDALAQDQMAANDVERSEEFKWAALALRAGVEPSAFEVTNNGQAEVYEAFVHAVRWATPAQSMRPLSHRSLIAWRRSGELLQVIIVQMFTDSAPVLHPFSMRPGPSGGLPQGPMAAASAGYFERGANGSSWMGVSGTAKIAEQSVGVPCAAANTANRPPGITCRLARYAARFNILFAQTRNRDSREVAPQNAVTRRIIAPEQSVAGVKLTFSCLAPTSSGCG